MAGKYKCPYCGNSYDRKGLVRHIEVKHGDILPVGYTPLRTAFNIINYGTLDHTGKCVICGGPTEWDEDKGRYDRICKKESCKKAYIKRFEDNMKRVQGVTRISKSIEGQEKMLAGRRISGRYRFRDGGVRTYTGSYEKDALMFMDHVLNCKSDDIMTPGPVLQYLYNDGIHWYIPDIYYIPYNLLIEVKDGGDKPNTRNMPEYRARQIAKEKHVLENTTYNYLRLTNKDCSQLLATMAELKMQLVEGGDERVININENMFAAAQGMMPMQNHKENDVYVVNYLQNNVFSGGEPDYLVSDSPMFDTVFYRDADGRLRKGDKKVLEDTTYDVYLVRDRKSFFENNAYDKVDEFIEEGFIYEAVFGKKMYTKDQIKFEPLAEETMDFYAYLEAANNMIGNYIKGHRVSASIPVMEDLNSSVSDYDTVMDIDGDLYESSNSIPGLIADKDNDIERYILRYMDSQIGGGING